MRIGSLVFAVVLLSIAAGGAAQQRIALSIQRSSPQDLALAGDVPGMPRGTTRFVRYAELSRLPQVKYSVHDDPNFPGSVELSGVSLDDLLSALGFSGSQQLIAAICDDGYEAHYTADYRATHHPFLVLRIAGKEPGQWPRPPEGGNYGPYLISHPFFRPAFHVLAHQDEAQIPYGVIRLRFYDQAAALRLLQPHIPDTAAEEGSRIAFQNCLRCHRYGSIGGTKSPILWRQLAVIARNEPESFGRYLVQPEAVNPQATMPPNPDYDRPTVAALTAYFSSLAPKVTP